MPPEPALSAEALVRTRSRACTLCPGFSSRSRTVWARSFSAFGRDGEGHRPERGEESGDLLIEEVARAGNLRFSRAGNGGDHDLFSALSAQCHVRIRFLLRKGSIDTGLPRKKILR